MRKLALALVVLFALHGSARAEAVGIGLFLGEPSGLDIKIGLGRISAVDVVIGANTFRDGRTDYFHLTYLLTPFVARGRSVLIPFRIGIGGAALGVVDGNAHFAVRVPLELGFRFRRTPIEIYGEIAIKGTFVEEDIIHFDADGGIGIRFYF
jgi:hypothetical protein